MDLIQALVLGIIQGLTEFLPISSTAHLRVVPALLEWEDPGAAFTAVIQLGTLLAVLIYFWKDLSRTLIAWLQSFSGKASKDSRLGWAIFIGTIPIVVAGYLYKDQIKGESVRSLTVIAWMLIGMGMLLFFADRLASHRKTVEQAGVLDARLAAVLVRAAGFRNVVAHAYDTLDMARVHAAARNGPADLRAFLAVLRDRARPPA